jgi:hypothetical protein
MKTCTSCDESKDESDFYLTSKGRPTSRCKECTKAAVRANYRNNVDQYRAYEKTRSMAPHRVDARKAYAKTPHGLARGAIAKKRYIETNPVKRKAHNKVWLALRTGRLVPAPCEVCGATNTQAHHDDYSKPLDVRWLCTTHHAEWHRHNTPLCPEQEIAA